MAATTELFDRIANRNLTVRRITIAANRVVKDQGILRVEIDLSKARVASLKNSSNVVIIVMSDYQGIQGFARANYRVVFPTPLGPTIRYTPFDCGKTNSRFLIFLVFFIVIFFISTTLSLIDYIVFAS